LRSPGKPTACVRTSQSSTFDESVIPPNRHNEGGIARPDTDMILRLSIGDTQLANSAACRTTFGVPTQRFRDVRLRVAPGDPAASAIFVRMSARGTPAQMPPIATEHVDADGLAALTSWIELPVEEGGCSGP
jgi:hypothetical protein